jgi:hypothetical protein
MKIQETSPAPESKSVSTAENFSSAVGTEPVVAENADSRCRELLAQLPTPERDDELIAVLEKLARRNPLRAIELARAETNSRLRARLLDAVFRGWGKMAAGAAADWILAQPENSIDHDTAIASVFKGAVENPAAAVLLAQQLGQKNPGQAREYGDALIYAFAQNGNFSQAADFAASNSDPQLRTEWLSAAYGSWVNYQPQNAAASAMLLGDSAARSDALNAVIAGWGQVDPKGLADFAENNLPAGDQKTHALSQALVFWAAESPVDVANWINQFGPGPEFDSGEAAIATQPDVMKQPLSAINWAETISDPNFRSRTVAAIVETWMLSDPSGALNFVQSSNDLTTEERTEFIKNQ